MHLLDDSHFRTPAFLAKVKEQDNGAIEALVRAYTGRFHNTLLGMGFDTHDAEELVQQVWVTFYDKAANFEGRSHIRTYLYGILYHKVKERRRMRRDDPLDDSVERKVDSRFDGRGRWLSPPMEPERFVMLAERMEIYEKCLEGLGESQRMAFTLKEVSGIDSKEICNVLGIKLTHLRVLLYRARNRLRQCIESRERGECEG